MTPIKLHIAASANPSCHPSPHLYKSDTSKVVFQCMASTCEILIDAPQLTHSQLTEVSTLGVAEAWRIEYKYSRYVIDNTWANLHKQHDAEQLIDQETQSLLGFAYQAWQLSDGLFDITSGRLREIWSLTRTRLPKQQDIDELMPYIGFSNLKWLPDTPESILIPTGVELDFGGIGKEYAVDRVLNILSEYLATKSLRYRLLVNFGGDLACKQNQCPPTPWNVGIESLSQSHRSDIDLELTQGALATSGDTKRFIEIDGKRFGHILNPKTGWPIRSPYRSVSVAGATCVQAGMLATLTLLQGNQAKEFINQTGVPYWLRSEHKTYTNQ
ncbi:FAD:protein FMN transferase [Marinomonas piezotolerans]|uniref:FAD:protein FMN transferase n=1 Tax=Marinomonas piezotolerans TaxID=2213058 RepID=A0A370UEB7_9GAMM|nr:FAD:protein FMN transferase [Marinomonas piezotolerans]RDL46109.1 FAD:protein FMN transferase [Marinomonas piezotolerans]